MTLPTIAEIRFSEEHYPILAANQKPDLCEVFEHLDCIRQMKLRTEILTEFAREFHAAAIWHTFRDRAHYASKYQRLAGNCLVVLNESLN